MATSRHAEHSERMRARHKAYERTVEGGEVLLRRSGALEALAESRDVLEALTRNGKLRTVRRPGPDGMKYRYWFLSELEEVKHQRRHAPRTVASPEVYSLETTAELTGIPQCVLRGDRKKCTALGLQRVYRAVRTRLLGERRRTVFTRRSVEAYRAKHRRPLAIPDRMMTVADAARRVRRDRKVINRLLLAGHLRGERKKFPTGSGPKDGWLVYEDSVQVLEAIIRNHRGPKTTLRLEDEFNNLATARAKPQKAKHLKWQEWKIQGMSYNEIADKEYDDSGVRPSRDAVIQALRRLK